MAKDETENTLGEYGQLHEKNCGVNSSESYPDECDCALRSFLLDAVKKEREGCAKVAKDWMLDAENCEKFLKMREIGNKVHAGAVLSCNISESIRKRKAS